jgi:hypothetical protein
MSRGTLASLLAFAVVASSAASADAAGNPSVSKIAEASVPEMLHPRDAPEGVPATEKIEGVRVERSSFNPHHTFLNVFGEGGRCVTIGAAPPGVAPSGQANASIRASSGAMPLRIERLVSRGAGEASLELVDAWLDVTTSAVREAATTRVPLTVLGKGPAGYEVYGFRKGEILHVVLPAQERLAYVDEGGTLGFTTCGHVRLTIDPSQRTGAMIVAAGRIKTGLAPVRRTAMPSLLGRPEPAVPTPADPMRQMRGIQISVSASRMTRDQAPLLSVSVGWAEEEPNVMPQGSIDPAPIEDVEFHGE